MTVSYWTDPQPNDDAPTVYVDLGAPLGVRAAVSGEESRELVGAGLPGNIRSAGLSIGGANLVAAHADLTRTPWAKGANRLRAGGEAVLWAEHDGEDPMPMGTWLIAPQSGSVVSAGISVQLREKQYEGRDQDNLLPTITQDGTEASWMIDVLLRQLGHYTTPPPVASCVSSLPMNGGTWEEGNLALARTVDAPIGWGGVRDALGPVGAHHIGAALGVTGWYFIQGFYIPVSAPWLLRDEPLYLTLDVVGTEEAWFGYGPWGQVHVRVDAVAHELGIRAGTDQPWVTVPYAPGLDPNHPQRVQVEIQRSGAPYPSDNPRESIGILGPSRARARSAHGAPWSAWAIDPWVGLTNGAYDLSYHGAAGSSFAGAQVTTEADPALWAPITARIDPLGGLISAPYLPASTDVWAGVQDVASSWLAAAWRGRDGVAQVRERGYLAGNGPVRESIDVGRRVEDLPWTLDPEDTADRLVVNWSPVDLVTTQAGVSPVLWEATEAVRLGPGELVIIRADLDRLGFPHGTQYSTKYAVSWEPMWGIYGEQLSTWSANPERDGTGPRPGDGALQVHTRHVSTGRLEVVIRNVSSQVLWTVDDQGAPHLKLRGWGRMDQEQQVTIERGLPAEEARNPLEVDLGRHVQRAEDAEAIADHLFARLSSDRLFRINRLRVVPDWTRDIGQIVELHHERSALRVKALIVNVTRPWSAAGARQYLDVVLLLPTYRDHREAWAGKTYADLKAHWAGKTYADLADDPLSTGA